MKTRPLFAALAIVTISLGTGAATAIYTVVDHVLLRPLPYTDAARLLALCETNSSLSGFCVASPANAADWVRDSRTIVSIGQARSWSYVMRSGDESAGISGGWAGPALFRTLGATASRGRLFNDDDFATDAPVVVLSDELWRGTFGSDSSIVGRTLSLDGLPRTVVGVLPAGFPVPHLNHVKLWVPMPADARSEARRGWRGFVTLARLAPGASIAAARAELELAQAELGRRFPGIVAGWGIEARPLLDDVVGPVRPTLVVFLGAAALVLLVSCVNFAHLLLARGALRAREFAIRTALGARPARIVILVLGEALVLAAVGAVGGVLLATWSIDAFLALLPGGLPRVGEIELDLRVFVVAIVTTLLCGSLAGLLPAWRALRGGVSDVIKSGQGTGGPARNRMRATLVVAEFALAFILAAGAGLLARTFVATMSWKPGFDREGLVTFWTYASTERYRGRDRVAALFRGIEEAMAELPGVSGVGLASAGPLFGGEESGEFVIAGRENESPAIARWFDMSPSFFPTLGVALRQGRRFTADDRAGAPAVAIVNETMARRYWPAGSAVGQRLRMRDDSSSIEIVGVVADIPPFTPGVPPSPEVYWPFDQQPRWGAYFVLRTGGTDLARAIAARLASIDPDLRPSRLRTMDQLVSEGLARSRFNMLLIGAFAAVALLLTAVGAYGVVATAVTSRTRELGVRMALGARASRMMTMVIGDGLALAAAGLLIGMAATAVVARLAAAMLHGVSPWDPVTYGSVALMLIAVAVVACAVPAFRAGRVDPMVALRTD